MDGRGAAARIYLADLVSGILHWAFDTWFDADITFIRRMVLQVREHHIHPQRIFDITFYHDAGTLSWIALLLAAPAVLGSLLGAVPRAAGFLAVETAVVFSPLLVFMLVFHKCGHRAKNPAVVRWLQATGLLLSPRHHMQHHGGNHDFNYCIVNGWGDNTLGRLGLFRALEWLVERTHRRPPAARRPRVAAALRRSPSEGREPAGRGGRGVARGRARAGADHRAVSACGRCRWATARRVVELEAGERLHNAMGTRARRVFCDVADVRWAPRWPPSCGRGVLRHLAAADEHLLPVREGGPRQRTPAAPRAQRGAPRCDSTRRGAAGGARRSSVVSIKSGG